MKEDCHIFHVWIILLATIVKLDLTVLMTGRADNSAEEEDDRMNY